MITIAIDGPSASGKTSTAKKISQTLHILHLNTGALYRAIAYYLSTHHIDGNNRQAVEEALPDIQIEVQFKDGEQRTFVNGEDVSERLYNSTMSTLSSVTSAYPKVREKMLHLQRDIAEKHSVVMEGRDITSVVLPHAKYKFYLTASNQERARRRLKDMEKIGEKVTFEQVYQELLERDERDSTREANPLVIVKDAMVIDTDRLSLEQVVEQILQVIKE